MTKYIISINKPKNSIINGKTITLSNNLILDSEDTIEIPKDYKLNILPDTKLTFKKLINNGELHTAGDIAIKYLLNYGYINNCDLLIINYGYLNNYGKIENYRYLYLLKATSIINEKQIINFSYIGGNTFLNKKIILGNNIIFKS